MNLIRLADEISGVEWYEAIDSTGKNPFFQRKNILRPDGFSCLDNSRWMAVMDKIMYGLGMPQKPGGEEAFSANLDLYEGISWPPTIREKIYPVFLPFMGCKTRCAFCSQDKQTGYMADWNAIKAQFAAAESVLASKKGEWQLAFYGGTFTALDDSHWNYCLDFASSLKKRGHIRGFVCSTRPDKLPAGRIAELAEAGCRRVELGVQTFAENALKRCRRPYTAKICLNALSALAKAHLSCCVQLMPGFPHAPKTAFPEDVKTALSCGIRLFRFYPCLVFKNTLLARWHDQGVYRPLTIGEAVDATATAWLLARAAGANVLRMGVMLAAAEKPAVQAGPFDDAFGSRVMANGLYRLLARNAQLLNLAGSGKAFTLHIPAFTQGYFWGWRGELKDKWQALGISGKNAVFASEPRIWLEPA